MAIDNQTKRRSTLHALPVADNAIGAGDRAHVLWIYSGLFAEGLAEFAPGILTLSGLPLTISGGTPVTFIDLKPAALAVTGLSFQVSRAILLDPGILRFRRIRLASPAAPFTGKKQIIIRVKGRLVVI